MNYKNGKIYKIESHVGDKIYIGSTTKQYLSQRLVHHRSDYKSWQNGTRLNRVNSFILFEEYGVENCQIVLLETFPCNSKDELHSREAHYIKTITCVNRAIPNRTQKEYKIDNEERLKVRDKNYREANKEKRQMKIECECGNVYSYNDKSRHFKCKKHIKYLESLQNETQ
jgi:hypothetical protein